MIREKIKSILAQFKNKESLLKIIKNKYFIAMLAFIILIVFIDENNLIKSGQKKRKLKDLQETEKQVEEKISIQRNEIEELDDNKNIERLAREKYLMKKDNEDLFIIVDDQ